MTTSHNERVGWEDNRSYRCPECLNPLEPDDAGVLVCWGHPVQPHDKKTWTVEEFKDAGL